MFKDLTDFISALDRERELARIGEPVSPDLEIAAVTDRVSKSPGGGPALLFERPTGFDMLDALKMLPTVNRLRDLMPRTVSSAPCQEVVRKNGSLDEFPILKTWPDDGG